MPTWRDSCLPHVRVTDIPALQYSRVSVAFVHNAGSSELRSHIGRDRASDKCSPTFRQSWIMSHATARVSIWGHANDFKLSLKAATVL